MATGNVIKSVRLAPDELETLERLKRELYSSEGDVLRLGIAALRQILDDGLVAHSDFDSEGQRTSIGLATRGLVVGLRPQPDGSYRLAWRGERFDDEENNPCP